MLNQEELWIILYIFRKLLAIFDKPVYLEKYFLAPPGNLLQQCVFLPLENQMILEYTLS